MRSSGGEKPTSSSRFTNIASSNLARISGVGFSFRDGLSSPFSFVHVHGATHAVAPDHP